MKVLNFELNYYFSGTGQFYKWSIT